MSEEKVVSELIHIINTEECPCACVECPIHRYWGDLFDTAVFCMTDGKANLAKEIYRSLWI